MAKKNEIKFPLLKNEMYYLKYEKVTIVGEQRFKTQYYGEYEYIRNHGSKLHFFNNDLGIDIFLSKEEFKKIFKP